MCPVSNPFQFPATRSQGIYVISISIKLGPGNQGNKASKSRRWMHAANILNSIQSLLYQQRQLIHRGTIMTRQSKQNKLKKNTAEYTITMYYDNTLVDAQLVDVLKQSAINQLSWLYTCEIQQTNNITTTKYLKKTREYLSTRKGNWTRDTSHDMNEYKE